MNLDLFKDVNTQQLANTISNCKDKLNYETLDKVLEIDNSKWQTNSKTTFINAVTKLITRYNELSNKLDSYSSIPALIGNYKSISNEINDLQQELSFLSEEEIDRKQLLQNEINNDYQALQNVLSQITNKIL